MLHSLTTSALASALTASAVLGLVGACASRDAGRDLSSDPKNCGAVAHDCNGGSCVDNHCRPVVLAPEDSNSQVWALTTTEGYVVWTDIGGTLHATTSDGRTSTAITVSEPPNPSNANAWGLAARGNDVYWSSFYNEFIYRASLPGGASEKVVGVGTPVNACAEPLSAPCGRLAALAIDDTNLYFTVDPLSVWKLPLAGGGATKLTDEPYSGALGIESIAVRDGRIYWASSADHAIKSMAIAGGPATVLAAGEDARSNVAVDAKYVYWTAPSATHPPVRDDAGSCCLNTVVVRRISIGGGTAEEVASGTDPDSPCGLVADSTALYWSTIGGGVRRRALDLGSSIEEVLLASGMPLMPCGQIALDAGNVYIGTHGVLRIAK